VCIVNPQPYLILAEEKAFICGTHGGFCFDFVMFKSGTGRLMINKERGWLVVCG
jgi:hypothetical protein